jgi:hypothetical protein
VFGSRGHVVGALAALGLCGCASTSQHEAFTPLEHAKGTTFEGYTEAIYELSGMAGRFGEAKLWSRGAYTNPEAPGTHIHLGMDFENSGDLPITVQPNQIRLESVQTSDGVLRDLAVSAPSHTATIAPRSTGRVELVFSLPSSVRPDEVQAFRAAWSVRANGQEFAEFTPFARSKPTTYYVPVHAYYYPYYPDYYPYYDPFWGPRMRVVIVKRPYPRRVIVRGQRHRR